MADISKCRGTTCPIKETCWRFTAPESHWQSYFFGESGLSPDKTSCYNFVPIVYKNNSSGYNHAKNNASDKEDKFDT